MAFDYNPNLILQDLLKRYDDLENPYDEDGEVIDDLELTQDARRAARDELQRQMVAQMQNMGYNLDFSESRGKGGWKGLVSRLSVPDSDIKVTFSTATDKGLPYVAHHSDDDSFVGPRIPTNYGKALTDIEDLKLRGSKPRTYLHSYDFNTDKLTGKYNDWKMLREDINTPEKAMAYHDEHPTFPPGPAAFERAVKLMKSDGYYYPIRGEQILDKIAKHNPLNWKAGMNYDFEHYPELVKYILPRYFGGFHNVGKPYEYSVESYPDQWKGDYINAKQGSFEGIEALRKQIDRTTSPQERQALEAKLNKLIAESPYKITPKGYKLK